MTIYKQVNGQGVDIVLIHGWGCDHRYMQPIAEQLSSHYRVTNIDLPGRGKSRWQPHMNTIHDIADAVLEQLPERAIYIPWSFGGLVTISIAARYPERVARIIGIATSPKFIEADNWPGVPKPGFQAFYADMTQAGFKALLQNAYDAEFANFNPKPQAYQQLQQLSRDTPEQDLVALTKGIHICDATDLRHEFTSLQCPIDLIFGTKDDCVPVSSHAELKRLNPAINLHIIPAAQHTLFWTHPRQFTEILRGLI